MCSKHTTSEKEGGADVHRRDVLQATTSVGVASVVGIGSLGSTQAAANAVQAQSDDDVLFAEDFENYSPGDEPSNFVPAGNDDQEVVETTRADSSRAYRMSGSHGGCLRALARIPLNVANEMSIQGYFRRGDGSEGCHNGNGRLRLHTGTSGNWQDGSSAELLRFNPDGTVQATGTEVGEYSPSEWTQFEVVYIRNPNKDEITYRCQINDGDTVTVSRSIRYDEGDLSALELTSDDFTVFWDDLTVQRRTEAEFVIDEVRPTDPVITPSEAIEFTPTVTNEGDSEGAQPVTLAVENNAISETQPRLASGESETVSVTIDRGTLPEGGEYTYSIQTGDSSVGGTITVNEEQSDEEGDREADETEEGGLVIEDVTPTEPVITPGESLEMELTVRNERDSTTEESVSLDIADETITTFDLELAAEEVVVEPLTIPDGMLPSSGEYEYAVRTDHDSVTGPVVVGTDASVRIDGVEPAQPSISPGDDLTLDVVVTNEESSETTEPLVVALEGEEIENFDIELANSESDRISVQVGGTEFDEPGEYEYTVSASDDSYDGSIVVESESARFDVVELGHPSEVRSGESFTVSAEIANNGGTRGSTTVEFVTDQSQVDSRTLELAGGNSQVIEFTTQMQGSGQELRLGVITRDDHQIGEIRITPTTESGDSASDDDPNQGSEPNSGSETDSDPEPNPEQGDDEGDSSESDDVVFEIETDSTPGLGVVSTVTSLGGLAYILKRRTDTDTDRDA